MKVRALTLALSIPLALACGGASRGADTPRDDADAETAGGSSWSDEQIEHGLAPHRTALARCAPGVARFTVRLELRASGHLAAIAVSDLDGIQNACVRDELAHFDLRGHVEAGRVYAAHVDTELAGEETALEAEMRSHVDRNRTALIVCALDAPATIEARWDGTGGTVFHLRGHETTDRERCVVDALAAGAPDTAGEVGAIAITLR